MTTAGAATSSPRDAAARLCLACGLCCNGSFFGSVELKAGDDVTALEALLPLERQADKVLFRQPCPALRGCRCTIYDQRPQICRGYRCRILRGVEETPNQLPAALEQAAQLSEYFGTLEAQLQQAGFLTADIAVPAAIKAFRMAYATALTAADNDFFTRHQELILRWKKTAWLMQVFDPKAAARLALPTRPADVGNTPV